MNEDKCIDWFMYQYKVTKEDLNPILWEAIERHSVDIMDLFRVCVVISGDGLGVDLLKKHIDIACKMADCGYNGAIAGEKLRDYFLIHKILTQ